MYLEHFRLNDAPFRLTPDSSFFCNYASHQEALNVLLVALSGGEGFIKITGAVGTGKTMLCRKLMNTLGEAFETLYVPNPFLYPTGLLMAVAEELGLETDRYDGMYLLFKRIARRLVELRRAGKRAVLCVDEAQAMPDSSLECIRLLSNLESERHKLLQVVFFAQPEFDRRLARTTSRQLRQRVTFSYHLSPLNRYCVEAYVNHRLRSAGYTGRRLFTRGAVKALYHATRGVPRLVNILCNKALMAAYGRGEALIRRRHVLQAIEDTESLQPLAPVPRTRLAYGSFVVLVALGTIIGSYFIVRHGGEDAPSQVAGRLP